MSEKTLFTREGLRSYESRIENKIQRLKNLYNRLAELAEVGGDNYHDNFSYEQQIRDIQLLDSQIQADKRALQNYKVIEAPKSPSHVAIGTKVTICMDDKIDTWEIVSFGCSKPEEGMVAYNTPLGRLLMGKKTGDDFEAILAKRKVRIKIKTIKPLR